MEYFPYICRCFFATQIVMKRMILSALVLLVAGWSVAATQGEDGSRLWLRLENANTTAMITGVKGTAMTELQTYWQGGPVVLKRQKGLPQDGYTIKSQDGKTVIAAASDAGLLYGAYHLLRLQQISESGVYFDLSMDHLDISEKPFYDLRILNHWDNPNGTVERGFAGKSIFRHRAQQCECQARGTLDRKSGEGQGHRRPVAPLSYTRVPIY
jgi:hypothetical protein